MTATDEIAPEDRLFGILCEDGGVIPCETQEQRDRLWAHMRKQNGKAGCRIPAGRLRRISPEADWRPEVSPT